MSANFHLVFGVAGQRILWTSLFSSSICLRSESLRLSLLRDLDLVGQRADVAADFLEGVVQRQDLGDQVFVDLLIDGRSLGQSGLFGGLHLAIQPLVFGRALICRSVAASPILAVAR